MECNSLKSSQNIVWCTFTVAVCLILGIVQAASGSVERRVTVRCDRFAGQDAGEKIRQCIQALPDSGGVADARRLNGIQKISSRIVVEKSSVEVLFGSGTYALSGVPAVQAPFGTYFLITGSDVSLVGSASHRTVFKLANGSQSIPITFYHGSRRGTVFGIELDGNKDNNVSLIDDTFQVGIFILNDSSFGAASDSEVTVRDCLIHDFNHNGVSTYGDRANNNIIAGNYIYDNGKMDEYGTGDGFNTGRGGNHNVISSNVFSGNQRAGVRLTTAGSSQNGNIVINNVVRDNGTDGILLLEQSNYGSVPSIGQYGALIIHNTVDNNHGVGVHLSSNNDVGFITMVIIARNSISKNATQGILIQSNKDSSNKTKFITVIANAVSFNTLEGIFVSFDVGPVSVICNTTNANGGNGDVYILSPNTTAVSNRC